MTMQSPNWNEAKIDPKDLAQQVAGMLTDMAQKFNANPTKFMANMKTGGGGLLGELSNPSGQTPKNDCASSQYYPMMGKGRSKKDARMEQLLSVNDAMGLPKSYKQMKDDNKQWLKITSGFGKKSKDPFSGGGDRALGEEMRLHNMRMQVTPQGMQANHHIAVQLGGGKLQETLQDAFREDQNPAVYRVLNNAADGHDMLKSAARNIAEDVKVDFVTKKGDVETLAKAMEIKEDVKDKITSSEPETSRILNGAADGNERMKAQAKQLSDTVKTDFIEKRESVAMPLANALELGQEAKQKIAKKMEGPSPFAAPKPSGYSEA